MWVKLSVRGGHSCWFSKPQVSALVKSVNPKLPPIQVRKIIEKAAEPPGANVLFANGMVREDSVAGVAR